MGNVTDDRIRLEREEAWIGDAVLALFAREWVLAREGQMDAALVTRMSSNQFLSALGNPTSVEARIGRRYREAGLEAACKHIEDEILPLFEKQERKRRRNHG